MGFPLWDLKKHIKSALKQTHNLQHNRPFLPHNFPWKCRRISHFLPHPIRGPEKGKCCLQPVWKTTCPLRVGQQTHKKQCYITNSIWTIIFIVLFRTQEHSNTHCTTNGLFLNSNGVFNIAEIAWCLAFD